MVANPFRLNLITPMPSTNYDCNFASNACTDSNELMCSE